MANGRLWLWLPVSQMTLQKRGSFRQPQAAQDFHSHQP